MWSYVIDSLGNISGSAIFLNNGRRQTSYGLLSHGEEVVDSLDGSIRYDIFGQPG
jgi:hypothetical protein